MGLVVVVIAFAGVLAYGVSLVVRFGWDGLLYRTRVLQSVGEMTIAPERVTWDALSLVCRVDRLAPVGLGMPVVGVRIRYSSVGMFGIVPLIFTKDRARSIGQGLVEGRSIDVTELLAMIQSALPEELSREAIRFSADEARSLGRLLEAAAGIPPGAGRAEPARRSA